LVSIAIFIAVRIMRFPVAHNRQGKYQGHGRGRHQKDG